MEKKQWVNPDLTIYGNVATLTQNTGCVVKTFGFNDDFTQPGQPPVVGSTVPCPV